MRDSRAVDQVLMSLRRLRKDEGLSPGKLHGQAELVDVFGEFQALAMYEFIAQGLEEIPVGLAADAARWALNVKVKRPKDDTGGAAKGNLTYRRKRLAQRWARAENSANQFDDHSKFGAVRAREEEGLRELAVWLVGMASRFSGEALTSDIAFTWASEETCYIFRGGALKNLVYEAEVRSLKAGLEWVSLHVPLRIEGRMFDSPYNTYGCLARANLEPDGLHVDVQLSRSLHVGETHRFQFQFDAYDAPLDEIVTPLARRERATLRLQFDLPRPFRIVSDGRVAALDAGGYFWRTWSEFGAEEVATQLEWVSDTPQDAISRIRGARQSR